MSWAKVAEQAATQAAPGVLTLLGQVVVAILRGKFDAVAQRRAEEASRRQGVKLGVDAALAAKSKRSKR